MGRMLHGSSDFLLSMECARRLWNGDESDQDDQCLHEYATRVGSINFCLRTQDRLYWIGKSSVRRPRYTTHMQHRYIRTTHLPKRILRPTTPASAEDRNLSHKHVLGMIFGHKTNHRTPTNPRQRCQTRPTKIVELTKMVSDEIDYTRARGTS
jgi:hypothetical protein